MTEAKNEEIAIATEVVLNQIFNFRGHKVMLDFHLALLYEVENRVLKQAVKRKQRRFPEDFMFQLAREEWRELITICDNLPEEQNTVLPHLLRLIPQDYSHNQKTKTKTKN